MKKQQDTPLVDQYLQSLHGMGEAETDEFFYTRLRARMDTGEETAWRLPLRPVWVVSSLVLMLALNAFMLTKEFSNQPLSQKKENTSIQSFAEAYDQTVHSTY